MRQLVCQELAARFRIRPKTFGAEDHIAAHSVGERVYVTRRFRGTPISVNPDMSEIVAKM